MTTKAEVVALAKQMSDAVKQYVAREFASLNTRLSTVETRTGALSMIAARGHSAESIAAFEALEARIIALEERLARAEKEGT